MNFKFSRNQWLAVGAAIAVVLIGIIVYFNRPSRAAERAVDKLAFANTGSFIATVQLENAQATQQVLGEQGAVEITLDGVFARSNKEGERDRLQADVIVTTKTESVSVTLEGETRFINDKAYVYIKKSPPVFGALTQLKGQWLELPRGQTTQPAKATLPDDLFSGVQRIGTETIDGEPVVKYSAVANEAAVVRMMDSFASLLGTRLTDAQVNNIRGSVQKVGQVPVELWIRRWGSDLRKLAALIDVPGGNKMRFTLRLKDVNTPVDITAPEQAVPLNEAVAATARSTSR